MGEFQDKIPREIIDNVFLFEFTIFCGLCGSLSHLLHYSCVNSRESALQHNDCINIIIMTPIMTQSIRFMSPIFAIATPHHHCFVCHKGAWLGYLFKWSHRIIHQKHHALVFSQSTVLYRRQPLSFQLLAKGGTNHVLLAWQLERPFNRPLQIMFTATKSDGQLNWDNLTFIRKFYTICFREQHTLQPPHPHPLNFHPDSSQSR